jgi:hypothetical protein
MKISLMMIKLGLKFKRCIILINSNTTSQTSLTTQPTTPHGLNFQRVLKITFWSKWTLMLWVRFMIWTHRYSKKWLALLIGKNLQKELKHNLKKIWT